MSYNIHFVRHGETSFNVEGRLQGQSNVPLNENGRLQASLIASRIAKMPAGFIDCIISSDLDRAADTARAIHASMSHQVPLLTDAAW